MKWSAHFYFTGSNDGLMRRLEPSKADIDFLEELKKKIRERIKNVFAEAKGVINMTNNTLHNSISMLNIESAVKKTFMRYLDEEDIQKVATLILNMGADARRAFLNTEPWFWVQGSYNYKTLNKPYHMPPQQMDIDDGTYMPMDMFREQPLVGHRLLLLLVDASLASLAEENNGWKASKMPNCGRIIIENRNVHVDIPMYAIPKDQFEIRKAAAKSLAMDSVLGNESLILESASVKLDESCVYLAVRGSDKWIKSDPETVATWFRNAVKRHKEPMRQICRYLKAWRDVQWEHPQLSSIALMKCVVDTFDNVKMPDSLDHSELLLVVTERLSSQLREGVKSPDTSDDGRLLFPKANVDTVTNQKIIAMAEELHLTLHEALKDSATKSQTLQLLNELFGDGVINDEVIKPWTSMPAYQQPRQPQPKSQMKDSMTSG